MNLKKKKGKSWQRNRRYKEHNRTFRSEKYNNQNEKLHRWAQQQKGEDTGNNEREDTTIGITQSPQQGEIKLGKKMKRASRTCGTITKDLASM